MGGKIKECLIFIKEMFNIKDSERGNPGIDIEDVFLIIVFGIFCTTAIFESIGVGTIPRALERIMDISLGYLIYGRGSKALVVIRKRRNIVQIE